MAKVTLFWFMTIWLGFLSDAFAQSKDLDLVFFPDQSSQKDTQLQEASQRLKSEVLALLPQTFKNQFTRPVKIFWFQPEKNQKGHVIASYRSKNIYLSESQRQVLLLGPQQSKLTKRTHKTEYKELQAAIIHELMHAFDDLNVHSYQEQQKIEQCRFEAQAGLNLPQGDICRYYRNMNLSLSQNPYYLQAAGFADDGSPGFIYRSPDPYELSHPKEHLAVNFEYFVLDTEFQCRRPILFQFFSRFFQHSIAQKSACSPELTYLSMTEQASNKDNSKTLNAQRKIDPDRIYQIHYFLAGEGDALMSGWGHAMFRVVQCAPERKSVGPDCMKDVSHHIVLSFRAFIDSIQINSMKGLTGAYPSRLFFVPMTQVIEEYNRIELRDLWSYPLKLDRQQIKQFMTRAIEMHWSYESRYYFVSNNCAVESLTLLKGVLFNEELLAAQAKTPFGVRDILQQVNLIDPLNERDRLRLIQSGYLFDSYEGRFQAAYQNLQSALALPTKSVKDYLDTKASSRQKINQGISRLQTDNKKVVAASAYIMETAAHRRFVARMKAQAQEQLLGNTNQSLQKRTMKDLTENLIKTTDRFSRPSAWLSESVGYGLPQQSELKTIDALARQSLSDNTSMLAEIEKNILDILSAEDLAEFEQIKGNIDFIQKQMKSVLPTMNR